MAILPSRRYNSALYSRCALLVLREVEAVAAME